MPFPTLHFIFLSSLSLSLEIHTHTHTHTDTRNISQKYSYIQLEKKSTRICKIHSGFTIIETNKYPTTTTTTNPIPSSLVVVVCLPNHCKFIFAFPIISISNLNINHTLQLMNNNADYEGNSRKHLVPNLREIWNWNETTTSSTLGCGF